MDNTPPADVEAVFQAETVPTRGISGLLPPEYDVASACEAHEAPAADRPHIASSPTASIPIVESSIIAASIPFAASSILSNISRTGAVLPRQAHIDRIARALTLNKEDYEQECSGGQRADDNDSVARDGGAAFIAPSTGGDTIVVNPNEHAVVLMGMGGIGKTTSAAMAVSRRDILRHFYDGVVWAQLGHWRQKQLTDGTSPDGDDKQQMPYDLYKSHLIRICQQLGFERCTQFEDLVLHPGDDDQIRRAKSLSYMESARQEMYNLLRGRHVLIVLDDVWHTDDVDWFNFGTHPDAPQRLLVTTRRRDLICCRDGARLIDAAHLEEDEAVELLLSECRRGDRNHDEQQLAHIRTVIQGCGYIPVAIRAAGRLLLTVSASGNILSLSNLAESIADLNLVEADPEQALFSIFDRSCADTLHGHMAADAMKACFASFTCVFPRNTEDSDRAWVPLCALHDLWEPLILKNERNVFNQTSKSVTLQILDMLERLGFIDSDTQASDGDGSVKMQYRLHHDLLQQYGMHLLSSKKERQRLFGPCLHQNGRYLTSFRGGISMKTLVKVFNELLVKNYQTREDTPDNTYMSVHLPQHMMKANMLKMTEDILCNKTFVQRRLTAMGTVNGTYLHVKDVEMLQHLLCPVQNKSKPTKAAMKIRRIADASFEAVSSFLCQDQKMVGQCYLAMGLSLQKQSYWSAAIAMLTRALDAYQMGNVTEDGLTIGRVRDLIHSSSLPRITLQPRDSPKVIRLRYANKLHLMQDQAEQMDGSKGDDKVTAAANKNGVPLELVSHPGLAICPLQNFFNTILGAKYIDLGVGPKESALVVKVGEDCIVRQSDGAIMSCHRSYNEGGPCKLVEPKSLKTSFVGRLLSCDFIINEDGGISPRGQPDIALGFGNPPLILVPRDSPNRLILKHAAELSHNALPVVGHKPISNEKKIFVSELSSHPDQAVVRTQKDMRLGSCTMNSLGLGPRANAVRLCYDGRILACADTGLIMKVPGSKYHEDNILVIAKDKYRTVTRWKGGGNDFVINDEGSISPRHAPNFALGAPPSLGQANALVTEEQRAHAELEAKRRACRELTVGLKETCLTLRNFLHP